MRPLPPTYRKNAAYCNFTFRGIVLLIFLLGGPFAAHAQFVLKAPTDSDQHNFRWYEAKDPETVLGTDFYLEVTDPGVYYATFDGTLCGSNATGYFVLVRCGSPDNEVTLDISQWAEPGSDLSWSPEVSGNPRSPTVVATEEVVTYKSSIEKAGKRFDSPEFTVACLSQSARLADDRISLYEDLPEEFSLTGNDQDVPESGSLTFTQPGNGSLQWNDGGTPNDPRDDRFTYTPDSDFNGTDVFNYTLCNASGDCSTARVTLDIQPVVDALDDMEVAPMNTVLDIRILANDNDFQDGDRITYTPPSSGSLSLNGQDSPKVIVDDYFTYTPNTDFTGTDTFSYTLCDDKGHCSTAQVTLVLTPLYDVELDSDDDGIADIFEDLNLDGDNDPATQPTDTDGDDFPDYLDIDSDNDGIPDNVEAQEVYEYYPPSGADLNGNGMDDAYEFDEILGLTPVDSDQDGFPDYVDEDSDDDGIPDKVEGHDWNINGSADTAPFLMDTDRDGLDDGYEGDNVNDIDPNDEFDDPATALMDLDTDGLPNFRDPDDDGDNMPTSREDTNGNGVFTDDDFNANQIPDYLDPLQPDSGDELEVFNVVTPNNDGIHDVLKIKNIENFPNNSIRIFNRWGRLVFSTRSYNSAGNVFDGTSQDQMTLNTPRKLPTGTYFYILNYTNSEQLERTLTGYIYVNR